MRSIITTEDEICFVCNRAYAVAMHHIFQGPNRDKSEDWGLKIPVCAQCHHDIHNGKKSKKLMKDLHELGQTQWESYWGPQFEVRGKDPRVEFTKIFGRNWLDDDQGETRRAWDAAEGTAESSETGRTETGFWDLVEY